MVGPNMTDSASSSSSALKIAVQRASYDLSDSGAIISNQSMPCGWVYCDWSVGLVIRISLGKDLSRRRP